MSSKSENDSGMMEANSWDVSSRLAFHANPAKLKEETTVKVQRRMSRNESEKHRRDRLNAYHQQIYELLPWATQTHRKMDKASILRLALHYVTMHLYCSKYEKEFLKPGYFDKKFNIPAIIQSSYDFVMLISRKDFTIDFATDGITTHLGHYLIDILGQPIVHLLNPPDGLRELQKQFTLKNCRKRKLNDSLPDDTSSFCLHMLDNSSKQHNKYQPINCIGYVKDFGVNSAYPGSSDVLICVCKLAKNIKPEKLLMDMENCWNSYHDLAGNIIDSDTRCALPSGFLPEETRAMSSYKLVHPEDIPIVGALHSKFMGVGSIWSAFRMFSKSKQIMFVMAHTYLVTGANNEPRHIVSNNVVISEDFFWRLREEQLKEIEDVINSPKAITMGDQKEPESKESSPAEVDSSQPSPDSSASVTTSTSSRCSSSKSKNNKNGHVKVSVGNQDERHIIVSLVEGDENSSGDNSEEESVIEDTRSPIFLGAELASDDMKVTVKRRVHGKKSGGSSCGASSTNSPGSNLLCSLTDSSSPQSAIASPYDHCNGSSTNTCSSLLQKVNKRMVESPVRSGNGRRDIIDVSSSQTASNDYLSRQHIIKNQGPRTSNSYTQAVNSEKTSYEHLIALLESNFNPQFQHLEKTFQDMGLRTDNPNFQNLMDVYGQSQGVVNDPQVQATCYMNDNQGERNGKMLPNFNSLSQQSSSFSSATPSNTSYPVNNYQSTYTGQHTVAISNQNGDDLGAYHQPLQANNGQSGIDVDSSQYCVNSLNMNNVVPGDNQPQNQQQYLNNLTIDPDFQNSPAIIPGVSSNEQQHTNMIGYDDMNINAAVNEGNLKPNEGLTLQMLLAKLTPTQALQLLSEKCKAQNHRDVHQGQNSIQVDGGASVLPQLQGSSGSTTNKFLLNQFEPNKSSSNSIIYNNEQPLCTQIIYNNQKPSISTEINPPSNVVINSGRNNGALYESMPCDSTQMCFSEDYSPVKSSNDNSASLNSTFTADMNTEDSHLIVNQLDSDDGINSLEAKTTQLGGSNGQSRQLSQLLEQDRSSNAKKPPPYGSQPHYYL